MTVLFASLRPKQPTTPEAFYPRALLRRFQDADMTLAPCTLASWHAEDSSKEAAAAKECAMHQSGSWGEQDGEVIRAEVGETQRRALAERLQEEGLAGFRASWEELLVALRDLRG